MIKRKDLIDELAKELGYTKKDAETVLDTVFNLVREKIEQREDVQIYGFGKFEVKKVEARNGVNPKTKEPIVVPTHYKIKFNPTETLKVAVK